jgi:flotillin
MPFIAIVGIAAVAAIVVLVLLFKMTWKVAEPNEALIVSGLGAGGEHGIAGTPSFRIVIGKGTLTIPGFQTVRRLSLAIREAEMVIPACVTSQGIPVGVRGVILFKVGDDLTSIANSARRFLDKPEEEINAQVHSVFEGHLRSIIGGLTVEEIIGNRDKLRQETLDSSGDEMSRLGLVVDALQIREVEDPTGYIKNLAMPHAAEVAKRARIAQAGADREATEREQEAEALKAEATKASQIKQAGFYAEVEREKAKAAQAGPLADAESRQSVVVQESRVAELEAEKREQMLQAEVIKPADAKAYETRVNAEAARDAEIARAQAEAQRQRLDGEARAQVIKMTGEAEGAAVRVKGEAEGHAIKAKGEAEGASVRAKGLAEADAIEARASALATNQEAVITQSVAERLPEIVAAAAKSFDGVDNLNVLNGAQGITEIMAQVLMQGGQGLQIVRQMLSSTLEATATNGSGNGQAPAPAHEPAAPAREQRRPKPGDGEPGA